MKNYLLPPLERCNRLLDEGYSLLTVGDNKQPNFSWKPAQSKALDKKEFAYRYDYLGGLFKKNGDEITATKGVGIVTGYNCLECIDVDLKVFSTAKERKEFWEEYISILEDNILDFRKKVVIYKTKNEGFHILYRSKRVVGNKKIASLKGHTEAVIESRGVGGYIFVYDGNNYTELTYNDVDYISDADRYVIWEASRTYDYIEPQQEVITKKESKQFENVGLTPWEDFNNRNSILDIISDELPIVRQLTDKYLVKRHGATSPHSGYVYKDSGCMYLFSTGTIYPSEKLISAFAAYAYKNHNGDFSQAAKQLYKDGYGERVKVINSPIEELPKIDIKELDFPLDVFPEKLQKYIMLCHESLNMSVDFMGCSLLWMLSVIVGNSMLIEVKRNWTESANLWLSLVGKAGLGKTPSVSSMVFPLMKINSREIKHYIKEKEKYDAYMKMDKQEKEMNEKIKCPNKTQFIVNDITLEALVELHEDNKNGVGVLKDELAGWLKDMNKYRQGSDLEHWLSSWSGKEINLNRKVAKSNFVERAHIPVIGGIQPEILSNFYTDENKENGFMDRMLFCFPDLDIEYYNDNEIGQDYIDSYSEYIISMYDRFKNYVTTYKDDGEIRPQTATFDNEAKAEWVKIFNEITDKQNSETENEYMKSMLPKQKSYIPRFALLINSLWAFDDGTKFSVITKESVQHAKKLSDYFIMMAKKIKNDNVEIKEARSILKKVADVPTKDKIANLLMSNPTMSKTKIADLLGVSRQTVHNHIKNIENEGNR